MFEPADDGVGLAAAEPGAEPLAGAVLACVVVGSAELGGAELVLDPELQAAAPASRQDPAAIARQLEPALIRGSFPGERPIAPSRLSAVDSPFTGPSARGGRTPPGVRN